MKKIERGAVYDGNNQIIGFRCSICDEVKSKMWGDICNLCRMLFARGIQPKEAATMTPREKELKCADGLITLPLAELENLQTLLRECREWISGNYNTSITAREFDRAYDNFRKRLDEALNEKEN